MWCRIPNITVYAKFSQQPPLGDLSQNVNLLYELTYSSKSLCFQIPAVIDHGITIVVSPLLALMNNQVAALRSINIPVATINSSVHAADRDDILKDMRCGTLNSGPLIK